VYEIDGNEVREAALAGSVLLRKDRMYFVNPGSVDAARKRDHKFAEFALLDSDTIKLEFQRIAYDDEVSETKAAASGYRIGPWTDRLYTLRRRLTGIPGLFSKMKGRLVARQK